MSSSWSVLLLAGGSATRLGGVDKATLDIDGRASIDLILDALPRDIDVVVAGRPRATSRPVEFRPDEPPGGGPVAGIAAALDAIRSDVVVVMAVDMPWAGPLIEPLARTCLDSDVDVVVAVDAEGHHQVLFTAWRTSGLRAALATLDATRNRAVREVVEAARSLAWQVPADASPLLIDIDTAEDLDRARTMGSHPT